MLQNQLKINLFLFRRFVDAVSKIDRPFQILRNHIRMSETQHPVYPVFLTELLHPALRNLPLLGSFLYRDMLVIDCPELNQCLRENASVKAEQSRHVLPDGTENEGPDFQGEMPFYKKAGYFLLRLLTGLFRYLL